MTALKDLKRKLLQNPDVRIEYEALKLEERLAAEPMRIRRAAGLTQAQLAKRIGAKQAAIARIESGRHLPSMDTLRGYAAATGRRLVVGFEATGRARAKRRKSAGFAVAE